MLCADTHHTKNLEGELAMALRRSSATDQVTSGAIPLHSSMDYKLATSRRPAQAVGYPAQG